MNVLLLLYIIVSLISKSCKNRYSIIRKGFEIVNTLLCLTDKTSAVVLLNKS